MRSTDTSLCYHYMPRKSYVVMLSSCEFYMHIIMLARACYHLVSLPSQTKILEGWTKDENADFEGSTFQGHEYSILATNR